ncbi:hypothetical protein [Micromonospora sp. KC606]|uniref:hypothetical protein n=1 Tax=Micromonospora sp. KC606 TaxID=2530379 RepID=UPI0014051BDB|nr:hypothetical protein [Micromonospora sp. KC606]
MTLIQKARPAIAGYLIRAATAEDVAAGQRRVRAAPPRPAVDPASHLATFTPAMPAGQR